MYMSLWENSRGHPDNVSFMQFSTKIDGFEQKDSQGFETSYNSYEQYPLEKFFIFTIYQNYTLALIVMSEIPISCHKSQIQIFQLFQLDFNKRCNCSNHVTDKLITIIFVLENDGKPEI